MAIAYLGYRVDSKQVATAEKRLDAMSGAAGVATKAARGFMIAAAAAFSGGALVRGISQFEESMSKVAAVSRATEQQLATMRDTARELGSTTEFSASQAADGLNFLAMAGFSATESVAAISEVLDLATASGMGLASAADIASNVISGFGLAATDAGRVANVLAATSARANTDVAQLGGAMSTVAPISAALGVSLEETAAALGVMADAGIQGERGGTALRGVMASLAGPTDGARGAIEAYGLAVSDVDPATNSLTDIMGRFSDVGLSAADAMTIFGREAASGALSLIAASGRVEELTDEVIRADTAAGDMADTMRDNLGGDVKGLMSALEGLMLSLGDAGLTEVLRGVIGAIRNTVILISDFIDIIGAGFSKIENFKNAVFNLGKTKQQTQQAIDNLSRSLRDEELAIAAIVEALPVGTKLTRDAAKAKLDQTRAIYAKIEAEREEARTTIMLSEEYRNLQGEVNSLQQAGDLLSGRGRSDRDRFTPNASREGFERNLELLQGTIRAQQELLNEVDLGSEAFNQAEETIRRLEAALGSATGEIVTMGGSIGDLGDRTEIEFNNAKTAITSAGEAAKRIKPTIEDATNAVSDMGDAVRDDLSRAWGDFVDRGFKDFDQFGRDVLRSFGNMLRDMITMAARNKIMIGLGFGGVAGGATSALAGGGGGGGLMSSILGGGSGGGMMGGIGAIAGALGGGFGNAAGALLGSGGGFGAMFSSVGAQVGTAVATGTATSIAAALGAVALPLAAVAATIMFFRKSTKELDNGLKVAIDGIDATAQTFKKIETSRFFGLSKKRRTTFSNDPDNPVLGAVASIQDGVLQAARVMGVGSKAFEDFAFNFKVSLKGLTEEQKLQKINTELSKMGDQFASIVPNFSNMNDLLEAANRAVAETAAMGSTRFESQVLAAARRRGEITMDRSGPGFAEGQSLIRLQKLEEIDTKVEENTRQNNRLTQKMVDLLERWEEVGIPRGPVLT